MGLTRKIWRTFNDARGNRKLKRLSVDEGAKANQRRSINIDTNTPPIIHGDLSANCEKSGTFMRLSRLYDGRSRFPRIEDMPHFHYDEIDLDTPIQVSLYQSTHDTKRTSEEEFTVRVSCRGKSWSVRRALENFIGLDKQIHRCIFDRKFSLLPSLADTLDDSRGSADDMDILQSYLTRLTEIADNVMNCGPVLNWFEVDNKGNHLLLTDDSAINVPAIAAAHVIKRYTAQGADEISLDVGNIISVIDMPPVDESIWWRGKRGYEVGFFPSQCVEVIGDMSDNHPIPATPGRNAHMKPVAKKRGKLISFLRIFLSSRPSRARLMQSGILKERTFGCDLGEHLAQTSRQIPLVLEACASVIEEHGIIDGIYRLTGSSSTIQKLRLAFDADSPPDLRSEFYLRDVHCISALCKMYFRELPNPLLTHHLYDRFVSAIHITDENQRKVAIHHVVQQLPPPHYRTLEFLLRHLSRVASQSSQTGMHAKNLAIVWAPNLLSPRNPDYGNSALLEINVQAILVEFLIRNTDELFDVNAASIAIVTNPQYNSMQERGPHHGINSDTDTMVPGTLGPRLASISVSPATKLISLEEARARATSVPAKPARPPPPKTLNVKPQTEPDSPPLPPREPYQSHPRLESENSGSASGSLKSIKSMFGRSKSFNAAMMTKSQETGTGTYFFVSQDSIDRNGELDSPVSYSGDSNQFEDKESLRQAYSAENLNSAPPKSEMVAVPKHPEISRIRTIKQGGEPVRPPRRSSHAEVVSITQRTLPREQETKTEAPRAPRTKPNRHSFTSGASALLSSSLKRGSAPITFDEKEGARERTASSGSHIRRRPILTSFKKVTSETSVFYTTIDSNSDTAAKNSLQRRASTGSSHGNNESPKIPEKRPLSVYDNRPASVYDNVNTQRNDAPPNRYSSPVFGIQSIPEETRFSMPASVRTPPLPRAYKGSGTEDRLAITGARLAQSSVL
ncbi:rho GTPase-activating protein 32-like isoform X2 [Actinia tenebrosa]|uniref:Rho GTPase-activating protein 32-like isoform X2 n=1 Tax=Actinia tenebrosa TaxID=6105 RepID=A0A6P8HWP2_ACTTE|nr:rho GTPase-activating protein 32-like isoform X2 [Actinia tenebrosa]